MSPQDTLEKLGTLFNEDKLPKDLLSYLKLTSEDIANIALDIDGDFVFVSNSSDGEYALYYVNLKQVTTFLESSSNLL